MKENWNKAKVTLTTEDMNELESGFTKFEVFGARAPEALMKVHDIGVNIRSSSIGRHGLSPQPDKK